MKPHHFTFFFLLSLPVSASPQHSFFYRRILHQPLFPETLSPPPVPETPVFPTPDQPFSPEVPDGSTPDQSRPAPATPANGTNPIAAAAQSAKPTKTVAIAISVGIVTLGMLSALAFFLYRHRVRHPGETQKLVGDAEESRVQSSSFLYIGTVEPSQSSVGETNGANGSPYQKINSVKISDRYRPSPELQPLPPLPKLVRRNYPAVAASPPSSDEESQEVEFYTPQCSSVSNEDSLSGSRRSQLSLTISGGGESQNPATGSVSVSRTKRSSPKSRLSGSSPDTRLVVTPPIKQTPPPKPPAPPPLPPQIIGPDSPITPIHHHQKPKISAPPPPPNWALLKTKNNSPKPPAPSPPAPPPPPRQLSTGRKVEHIETGRPKTAEAWTPCPREASGNGGSSSGMADTEETEGAKPKLKALHWDKVRATSDRATVWDNLKSTSFQLNEDMMESLFGCSSVKEGPIRRSVVAPVEKKEKEKEKRVLDPKKSHNIAILLRALNVTRDEVTQALMDGNPESLGAEVLESLVKMGPTKEEEMKLREYGGDVSKLGSAEQFLKELLLIPFAFQRVEAMLYTANFHSEVQYLRTSFHTLEAASEELKNSRLFLKLIEAVLTTGNRMNVGTNRGDAKAFKLDTLLKLVDIKGTDGKTTLLHFVVQEIIRAEAECTDSTTKIEELSPQGLQVVSSLGRDLSNVKKAAGMDSDVLSSYVSKLAKGLEKVTLVLQYEKTDAKEKFFESMRLFVKEAEEEINQIKADEKKAISHVKDVTHYFHGNAAREEAHPLRIFMVVRDFVSILDNVCKEVGTMQDRTMAGSGRSFRMSANASLPVLNRYNVRRDRSSDEESSSP